MVTHRKLRLKEKIAAPPPQESSVFTKVIFTARESLVKKENGCPLPH